MRQRYLRIIAAGAVAAALISGCLFTGTVVVTAKLAPDAASNPITISNLSYSAGKIDVDLNNDPTFNDYKDNINNIDNIGFYGKFRNNNFFDLTFQVFLESDPEKTWTSAEMAADSATALVFTGLTLSARETTEVTWNESMEYITNLDDIKAILETGRFSIYPAVVQREEFNIAIDSLVLIITLTGSK